MFFQVIKSRGVKGGTKKLRSVGNKPYGKKKSKAKVNAMLSEGTVIIPTPSGSKARGYLSCYGNKFNKTYNN